MKSLNGSSATHLNKLENKPGRRIWRNYWDRCPRDQRDFYTFFNYIHLNPWKHGIIKLNSVEATVVDDYLSVSQGSEDLFLDCLASYSFSSFGYYLRKYGHAVMWEYFRLYPVLAHLEGEAP